MLRRSVRWSILRVLAGALVVVVVSGRVDLLAAGDPEPTGQPDAATPAPAESPWLLVPVVSSNPKLGTAFGGMGAYLRKFDDASQVSMFGATYQYTSTESTIAGAFARTSWGADHHRLVALAAFGYIKNDYDDYLGTGQSLRTDDDFNAIAARYLYRAAGDWFIGVQGNAADYQVLGASPEDDLVLETLGIRGFASASIGAVVMHDSRDNPDIPTGGWYLNLNNLAYRESFGGSASFDAYRADLRLFWRHAGNHVLAARQYNWLTKNAPANAEAAILLRGYKIGEYLAPYMSSFEAEERLSFGRRWGATLFGGAAALYGDDAAATSTRDWYPGWGAGVHFIVKPAQRMLVNFEYAQGIEENRGFYLKFGYGW